MDWGAIFHAFRVGALVAAFLAPIGLVVFGFAALGAWLDSLSKKGKEK